VSSAETARRRRGRELLLYSLKHQITGWFRMLSLGSSGSDVFESVYVLPGATSDAQDRMFA
jgi:hypothetical protein